MRPAAARRRILAAMDIHLVTVRGEIKQGDARGFLDALVGESQRSSVVVEFDSPGGLLGETRAMARAIEHEQLLRPVTGRAIGRVASGAALPFLTCASREATADASFMIHQTGFAAATFTGRETAATLRQRVATLDEGDRVVLATIERRRRLPAAVRQRYLSGQDVEIDLNTAIDLGWITAIASRAWSRPVDQHQDRIAALDRTGGDPLLAEARRLGVRAW